VPDVPAAREKLKELITAHAARWALCWEHPLLDRLGLAELLASLGVERIMHSSLNQLTPQQQRERALAADIGITSTTFAIAETGTLAVASGPGTERMASLLPPVHVAIVEASQVLPDLFDLFARLERDGLGQIASNLALITGPSKTGDIELRLTTGVHGPGVWHVIIIP
jgi:L-lactate dehydrogenase complex protein LldG